MDAPPPAPASTPTPTPSTSAAISPSVEPPASFGRELRALTRLAIPLTAVSAGQQLMGAVDTAIVGRISATALGAVGLANSLFFGISVVGLGVMLGIDPLASQAFGANDPVRARQVLWQGVWLALIVATILAVPLLLTPLFLAWLGIDAAVTADARRFLLARIPGLVPFLIFFCVRSYLQALGRTRPLVVAMLAGNVVNVIADLLLVFGGASLPSWTGPLRLVPALGVTGAAIATTLSLCLQVPMLAIAIAGVKVPALPVGYRRFRADDVKRIARVGIPVGLQYGAEVGVFSIVAVLAAGLGPSPLAAHQIALTLASITFTAVLGLSSAGSARVGLAIGARDPVRVRRAGLAAFALAAGIMSLGALSFLLFPASLARLLTDDPVAVAAAVPLLGVAAVFQLSDGTQGVGAGLLRGAGDTRFAFLANVAGHYAIGLPIALLLGFQFHRGIVGMWWGLCAGLTVVGAALLLRFLRLSSREIKPLESRR